MLAASTIINYHIIPQVICEMWNIWACIKNRSSRPEVFCKKGVLRNFTKFTGKHLYQSLFFNKVAGLRKISYQKIIKMTYQNGQISKMTTKDSKLVRCYGVSKTSVSFRYQLKRLCDVLNWSVSLRYQLVRRYDVSNWSVLFTHQWDVTKTSQIGLTNLCTSCDVMVMSQHGPGRSN